MHSRETPTHIIQFVVPATERSAVCCFTGLMLTLKRQIRHCRFNGLNDDAMKIFAPFANLEKYFVYLDCIQVPVLL